MKVYHFYQDLGDSAIVGIGYYHILEEAMAVIGNEWTCLCYDKNNHVVPMYWETRLGNALFVIKRIGIQGNPDGNP